MVVAQKVEGPYEIHDFTVAVGTTISAMTLCKLTSPRTASASTAGSTADVPIPFAGIAFTEKPSTSNATQMGLATKGTFNIYADADVTAGRLVTMSGTNMITPMLDDGALMSGAVVGKALQDITAGSAGEIRVGEII